MYALITKKIKKKTCKLFSCESLTNKTLLKHGFGLVQYCIQAAAATAAKNKISSKAYLSKAARKQPRFEFTLQ